MEALLHFSHLLGSIKRGPACSAHSDSELYCLNNFAKQICKKLYGHPSVFFFFLKEIYVFIFLLSSSQFRKAKIKFSFLKLLEGYKFRGKRSNDTYMQANISIWTTQMYHHVTNQSGLSFKLSLFEHLLRHVCTSSSPHSTSDALKSCWRCAGHRKIHFNGANLACH